MAHAHGGDDSPPVRPGLRRGLAAVTIALALATLAGVIVLRPSGGERPNLDRFGIGTAFYDARVRDVQVGPCENTQPEDLIQCRASLVELLEGPDKGKVEALEFPDQSTSPELSEGDKIVLSFSPESEPGFEYQFADRQRKPVLFWLALLFGVAVVLLGRLRGMAALAGLAASLAVLLAFTLPAIVDGRSPVWVAVVSAAAISFFALYLAHGLTAMTTVALLGTVGALALTSVLAVVFVGLASFSGFGSEEAIFLSATTGAIDLKGLLLAGVIIGALGALDDMTVTQASAVWELRAANPSFSRFDLYRAGLRIGRDHVASTVNTLALAYAGASMPLLVLFVLSQQSLGSVANSEVVAAEIARTLVGSIGLVAAVPLTTWLAVLVAPGTGHAHPIGAESSS